MYADQDSQRHARKNDDQREIGADESAKEIRSFRNRGAKKEVKATMLEILLYRLTHQRCDRHRAEKANGRKSERQGIRTIDQNFLASQDNLDVGNRAAYGRKPQTRQ